MAAASSSHKSAVTSFKTLTNASDSQAMQILRKHGFDVAAATNEWFSTGMKPKGSAGKAVDTKKIAALFAGFADAESGLIEADGLQRFCESIGVDMFADTTVLMIGFFMQAPDLTEISSDQFTRGLTVIGVSTAKELIAAIPAMRARVTGDPAVFASFFKYAFESNLGDGMRVLDCEVGVALLRALLGSTWALTEAFCGFLESKGIKTITKDTWMQTLAFSKAFPTDTEAYDEDAAWPVLIDDFVASQKGGATA